MKQAEPSQHLPQLRYAGRVLVVIGLLDILLMIVAVMNRVSYSSSLNIFAVIAGVFLMRGSLRAASLVRWFAFFLVAAMGAGVLALPFVQPLGLTWARVHSQPGASAMDGAFFLVVLAIMIWLARSLGAPQIVAARTRAGRPKRDMRIPSALGVILVVGLVLTSAAVQRSESAARAVHEARLQLGDGYNYHVSSLNFRSGPDGTVVHGVVTAWRSDAVRDIPFRWRE